MKAVAAALVLIAGAAVVLWYGNTLNSWVLGGLIGGLAALLLSIPISLTVFSYLSRRHDEQVRADVQEEMQLAQTHEYGPVYTHPTRMPAPRAQETVLLDDYRSDAEPMQRRQALYAYEDELRPPTRNLPAPASSMTVQKAENARRPLVYGSSTYQLDADVAQRPAPPLRAKDNTERRVTRKINYPGFHGYQPGSERSLLQAAALREARREAVQQDGEDAMPPSHTTRRLSSLPLNAIIEEQRTRSKQQRVQRPPATEQKQAPTRRIIDAPARSANAQRFLPAAPQPRQSEPQTDYLPGQPTQSGPVRQTDLHTGHLTRNTHIHEQPTPAEETGPIQHTLLRRAPYLYADDPLRQQLAQQLDATPPVRRSSRLPQPDEE